MSVEYDQSMNPSITSINNKLTVVVPIEQKDFSLFNDAPKIDEEPIDTEESVLEDTSYSPSIGDMSSPITSTPPSVDKDEEDHIDDFDPEYVEPFGDDEVDGVEVFDKNFYDVVFGTPDTKTGLMEATVTHKPNFPVWGITNEKDEKKKTKLDVIKSHLNMNSVLYNNLVYSSEDFLPKLKAVESNEKLAVLVKNFFPSFKIHNYVSRSASTIGGLYEAGLELEKLMYDYITKKSDGSELKKIIDSNYRTEVNWYKTADTRVDHIVLGFVCNYVIRKLMVDDKAWFMEDDANIWIDYLVANWRQRIEELYTNTQCYKPYTPIYLRAIQDLHDLWWDPLDDPHDPDAVATAQLSFINAVGLDSYGRIEEATAGEMVSKEDLALWLKDELDDEALREYYLLPDENKYLIFGTSSVKYAMDYITKVDAEDRNEYAKNLNRLYHFFGCKGKFKISVDHPYAKYLNCGHKIDPGDVIVNIIEGVVEDKSYEGVHNAAAPERYRIVDMYYQDGRDTVRDLDPDHKKGKLELNINGGKSNKDETAESKDIDRDAELLNDLIFDFDDVDLVGKLGRPDDKPDDDVVLEK